MINKDQFQSLSEVRDDLCVSIYIHTDRANSEEADRIRFKTAVKEARDQMILWGVEKEDAEKYLSQAIALEDDQDFWRHQSDGLAVFISDGRMEKYTLPVHFANFVNVGKEFYLKPLLPMFTGAGRFFVMALSKNSVRFFEGNRHSISPVIIDDLVPTKMSEAILEEMTSNDSLQFHDGGGSGNTPIYHGQGSNEDREEVQVEKYFRQINEGLMKMIHDERVPMVIASVDEHLPVYKEVNTYNHLHEQNISGNPDDWSPVDIHAKAWEIVGPKFSEDQASANQNFMAFMAEGKASSTLMDVVPAAINGRVDTLFMVKGQHAWGAYNFDTNTIEIHPTRRPDSICLMDHAAVKTFSQGGEVYLVERTEMPQPMSNVNAIYRF